LLPVNPRLCRNEQHGMGTEHRPGPNLPSSHSAPFGWAAMKRRMDSPSSSRARSYLKSYS
jgi:hypothetical protein